MNTKATARVTVTLEVSLSQPWPKEATIEQIQKRAKEEAMNIVEQHITTVSGVKVYKKPLLM